jgi:predicted ATPase
MFSRIKIEKYRGFQSCQLDGMTGVNLLVGKNNSGKTALLEGIHFLASGGDPMVLISAARQRGEVVIGGRDESSFLDVSHFFHGHDVEQGSFFSVSAENGTPPVTAKIILAEEVEQQESRFDDSRDGPPAFALNIEGGPAEQKRPRPLFLSEEGGLLDLRRISIRQRSSDERGNGPPIVFITPESVEPGPLGAMWNNVLRDKREGEVRQAMQILEPRIEDIVFQTGESMPRPSARHFAGRSRVLVSLAGDRRRVPMGSMGDGMRRLLALSISLIHARGGFLIVDEIDTGFHYSIMAKMWELVVRIAKESKIQVFATTHSADCVRGLGILCKQNPELKEAVCVHKIESDLGNSVRFSGADVLNAIEHDIELR